MDVLSIVNEDDSTEKKGSIHLQPQLRAIPNG